MGTTDQQARVVEQVREACEQIGFLTITGHGVPAEQIERTAAVARAFFDLPDEEKKRLSLTPGGAGYSPLRGESLAATLGQKAPADLKESLNVGADFESVPWPARPPELRSVCVAYFQAMNRLAGDLMRIFAAALELPEDYFAGKIDRSSSFLRIINYPPQTVEPEPGAFVVNIGDMMMRWTNDRWVSTLHRVVNPPAELRRASRRQSLAFFHNPNPDAVVECLPGCCGPDNPPRYPPIAAGEFITEKSRKAYGG